MRLRNRLALVIFGIIAFIVGTPLLVLYARGFKYDFHTHQVVKTGALVVATEPSKATVSIDGRAQKSQTPLDVRFMLPGDYEVRITKDGYQDWAKRLTIKSQLVTWANFNRDAVDLFLSQPVATKAIPDSFATVAKSRDQLAYLDGSGLHTISAASATDKSLGILTGPPTNLTWPLSWADGKSLQAVLNLRTLPIPTKLLPNLKKIDTNQYATLALVGTDLYSIANSQLALIDNNVNDFTLDNQFVWYVQGGEIKQLNLTNQSSQLIAENLPSYTQVQIIRPDDHLFLILDGTLYQWTDSLQKIYSPVIFANWDDSSAQLLLGNTNEILVYNPATNNSELIQRTLSPLRDPVLNEKTGYVFFEAEHKIRAVELDSRDQRNTYDLVTVGPDFRDFMVSTDGSTVYLINASTIQAYQVR